MYLNDKKLAKEALASIDAISDVLKAPKNSEGEFPYDRWKVICESGLFKRAVDTQMPKRESFLSTMFSLEYLGELCVDAGLSFSIATHLASTITALNKFGSSDLKERYMEKLLEGRIIGAHAISEPGAGSDALSMTTTATESGDSYILNGHKAFVTNGSIADVIVVYAKTSDSSAADCVSAFLVDTRSEGVELGPTMETVGLHTSPLCELKLTNCRVPKTHMVGRKGAGFFVLSHVMQREILFAFIISIGEMKRRLKRSVDYASTRHQFGTPLGGFQSVSNRIADMKISYELSRNWLYHVAEKMIANKDVTSDVAIAKVFISESALETSINALHIHGGYGYVSKNGLGEEVCNALAGPIYSGTNDIQRGRIAAMLGVASKSKPRKPAQLVSTNSESNEVLDSDHTNVKAFVEAALGDAPLSERDIAVKLYYAVRDKIAYEVFDTDISPNGLRASSIVKSKKGFCLHKAILFATACRTKGIDCRLVANRVNNHISTPELQNLVGGEVFLHWYNEVKVDGKWLKVSPVFNKLLCRLYAIEPLEFDGKSDAIAQPYKDDSEMNYLGSPEIFENPTPVELIKLVNTYHPKMITPSGKVPKVISRPTAL
ncbi:Acyl-CoA dehydrogenase, short-chain specific [Grimontia celer]|uniref:Acyl-CoA dehydrogenase, short-chain specific n=1 Tax=Grimontia celer TaxID=1796497 RepID=A0A128ESS1_9GAMM|nr:acyl-CoA dehydrogenase family protein [Grimontia celer]CZF77619.1 Acyl-CoA dehydrogenase, short-chain specific [Grimontia celer]